MFIALQGEWREEANCTRARIRWGKAAAAMQVSLPPASSGFAPSLRTLLQQPPTPSPQAGAYLIATRYSTPQPALVIVTMPHANTLSCSICSNKTCLCRTQMQPGRSAETRSAKQSYHHGFSRRDSPPTHRLGPTATRFRRPS
jgi:hypothetical protein